MEKVYVTEGELKALDKSIEKHRKKQKDLGWCCMMRKKEHKALIDKLIEIRERCVVEKTENAKVV